MAIEIVDLPIEHGDFPSFFCMFTRLGMQLGIGFGSPMSPDCGWFFVVAAMQQQLMLTLVDFIHC